MAPIEFSSSEIDFFRVGDFVTGTMADVLSDGEKDSGYRSHHPGTAQRLQLRAGSHVVRAGGSMYVTGGTVYSFRAGPDGLRFFNFRPRADTTYLTPAEAVERRRAGADAAGA
jgi:hypothetical protein